MSGSTGTRIILGGTAVVCCVHDRVKREVATRRRLVELGQSIGVVYNPFRHKVHLCACCENLFVDPTDTPRFCSVCSKTHVHPLGGPLPEPIGVTDV